jgi:hypothetical protein
MRPEEMIREAFTTRANQVEVAPDALSTIRTRIRSGKRRQRVITVGFASLATAAVAAAAVLVVVFGRLPLLTHPAPAATNPSVVHTDEVGPTDPPVPPVEAQNRLPVYLLGRVNGAPVLYREYHPVAAGDGSLAARIRAALTDMISGAPLDPDYHCAWPATTRVNSVQVSSNTITVDLSQADSGGPADEPTAFAAVQELVHTATAVAADQKQPKLTKVRLTFDGATRDTLWGLVDVSGPLSRASSVDTLARVWLSSPQEGDVVGKTFDVQVVGVVWEATARLRILNDRGQVVLDRPVTLDKGAPSQGQAHVSVTLPPGRYTVQAFYISAADSSEQSLDDHIITVGG